MATTTIIAVGATDSGPTLIATLAAGASLDVYLALGAGVTEVPLGASILIQKKNGSEYVTQFVLSYNLRAAKISGAGDWYAKRGESSVNVGLVSEPA